MKPSGTNKVETKEKSRYSRKNSLHGGKLKPAIRGGLETRRCEFKSRSRQRIFCCSLQCQINMNLVFHISEDGSENVTSGYFSISTLTSQWGCVLLRV